MGSIAFFSTLALLLGLFGATYTAISAIRTHWGKAVETATSDAPELVALVRGKSGEAGGKEAQRHARTIKICGYIWNVAHILPIAIFTIAAFGIAECAIWNWGNLDLKMETNHSKWIVQTVLYVNAGCLMTTSVAYLVLRSAKRNLDGAVRVSSGSSVAASSA